MAASIILPKIEGEAGMLSAIQSHFGKEGRFNKIFQDPSSFFTLGNVELTLPSFKVDASPILLNDPLTKMGIEAAFNSGAEFGRLTDSKPIMISQVLHKAVIDVDEKGTEACAATAISMTKGASRPIPAFKLLFNRPFLFIIHKYDRSKDDDEDEEDDEEEDGEDENDNKIQQHPKDIYFMAKVDLSGPSSLSTVLDMEIEVGNKRDRA